MEAVACYNDIREHNDERPGISWDIGYCYQVTKCPACSQVSFRKARWHSGSMDPSEIEYDVLFPASDATLTPRGLPETVLRAYESALKVRAIDANAYGVLLGRVVEFVCKDRQANGETLEKRLADLAEKNEIPERLVEVAKGLRQLRNVGAHADLGELTDAEVPVLDNLTRAILEYVYTAPVLVADAERCLKRLKDRKRNGSSDAN
jgi:hypothetical protein